MTVRPLNNLSSLALAMALAFAVLGSFGRQRPDVF